MIGSILVVDDEEIVRNSLRQWLELGGFEVWVAGGAPEAIEAVRKAAPDVVLTDYRMAQRSGLDLMRDVYRIDPDIPVVMLTAHGDVPLAVAAMREGAYDFLQKPYDPELLSAVMSRATERRKLKRQLRQLANRVAAPDSINVRLIGLSKSVAAIRASVLELAAHDRSVIISGETGTGKEVVARALHDYGSRSSAPFVAVNCAAIPAELFESELFGHEAGAFTSARGIRIGKFEHASSGTLLLDEIESMPLSFQAKILRALQERVIERIGSNKLIPIDVRVIAAAKGDLAAESRHGRFRSDLYFRLAAAEIHLPPLRERGNDVLLLFEHFADAAAKAVGRPLSPLRTDDLDALLAHEWPGNVRELKNVAERYALGIAATGRTVGEILRRGDNGDVAHRSLADRVSVYERTLIETALRDSDWSITAVTEQLRLPRRTLNEKMAKYGLSRSRREDL
ncbi:C4-dicarboxylate transport transcriptional regulatory protein dctD [Bradyrhizobium sp. ORS 285]|uniref:sigma-54-dependent transcriptional regulator n=1 Tax=Bradyrhizobium sp. ORS 285 TaxID=115808 RepID=UPI0002405C65|nr:sigma-54 dependent transcriptional regulator [Bradyrhizobium sp. ORS 285]CCD87749.1 C4-dicarboxylate transport transcriptional regulatory protein dctD [Bradyrhizobium sp. ORS 285]SMX56430.1 C4-dicarboxylate transport transcriptional regulatory protein dctD [Bradyrhizobium sp. ORS 285]